MRNVHIRTISVENNSSNAADYIIGEKQWLSVYCTHSHIHNEIDSTLHFSTPHVKCEFKQNQ